MQGITGKLSGKMGAAVFRVREGQQVVTQYNPLVKNPNTAGQQSQRAKFKLMSQLAAIMAPAMGSFIIKVRKEGGKQTQRNAFVQSNFPLVEVSSDNQEVTAKIPMEELKLTSSFRTLPQMTAVGAAPSDIEITMNAIATDVTTIRFVVVGYRGEGQTQATIEKIQDVPVENGTIDTSITVTYAGKYTVLAYGLIPSEAAKTSIDLDNIHTPADEDFISAVQLNAMVADGSMAETMTVGTNVTIA